MTQYLYHGTSSVYIPYLLENGLTGRYPDDLYNKLSRLWKWMKRNQFEWNLDITEQEYDYIKKFFYRRDTIEISLTTRLETAEEYIKSDRIGGEGISFLLSVFVKNWEKIKTHYLYPITIQHLIYISSLFEHQTGIILAFKKNELLKLLPEECPPLSPVSVKDNTRQGMTTIFSFNNKKCLTQNDFMIQTYKNKRDEIFFDEPIPVEYIYIYTYSYTSPPQPFIDFVDKPFELTSGITNTSLSKILQELYYIVLRNALSISRNIIVGGTQKKRSKNRRTLRIKK